MRILLFLGLAFVCTKSNGEIIVPVCSSYNLVPNQTVYIQNFQYPGKYSSPFTCTWTFTGTTAAGYFKQIQCFDWSIDLRGGTNATNYLQVNAEKGTPPSNSTFGRSTKKETLNVTLSITTASGKFKCAVKLARDPCQCSLFYKNITNAQFIYTFDAGLSVKGRTSVEGRRLVFCAASILSETYSITTATCTGYPGVTTPSSIQLVAGITTESLAFYDILEFVVHPGFVPATRADDVAILRTTAIAFNENVGVACLLMHWTTVGTDEEVVSPPRAFRGRRQVANTCNQEPFLCDIIKANPSCKYLPGSMFPWQDKLYRTFGVAMVNCIDENEIFNWQSLYDPTILKWILAQTDFGYCQTNCEGEIGQDPCSIADEEEEEEF